MTRVGVSNEYFRWMLDMIRNNDHSNTISYKKLLTHLHNTTFIFSIHNDQNRAEDGISLRYRFAITQGYEDSVEDVIDILNGPCSVLEMLVALASHCEEWMDNPKIGDRTGQWFWGMIVNLGLGSMTDKEFDRKNVDECIKRFMNREYDPDGKGGLFTIKDCDRDLRTVEIWYQLCWYLDSIT